MNLYEQLGKEREALEDYSNVVKDCNSDRQALNAAIRENESETELLKKRLHTLELLSNKTNQDFRQTSHNIDDLGAKIKRAEYEAALDELISRLPSFDDTLIGYLGRTYGLSEDIETAVKTLDGDITYRNHPNMVVNYRDVQQGYNNDLREIARQMIETGASNYAKSRLDIYPQTLMKHQDIRAFVGVI